MLPTEDHESIFIHPFMNKRVFIWSVSVEKCWSIFLHCATVCKCLFFFCHCVAVIKDFTDKCSWILTSVFESIIPLSHSVSGVTWKALKRLNRSEQEADTVPAILCQCCYDIVWMLVETNHLGLIEKLINRQGETKRKPMLAAFVLTLNSALIWNVPAVHCTQKKLLPFPNLILAFALSEEGLGKCRPQAPGVRLGAPGKKLMDRSGGEYSNRLALTLGPVWVWKEAKHAIQCACKEFAYRRCVCAGARTRQSLRMCRISERGVQTFKEVLLKKHG